MHLDVARANGRHDHAFRRDSPLRRNDALVALRVIHQFLVGTFVSILLWCGVRVKSILCKVNKVQ